MSTTQTAPKDKSIAQNPEHEGSWMPKPVLRFYAKFPLVVLPAEQAPSSIENRNIKEPVLWVKPTEAEEAYGWASSDPTCLRTQLLFLLRNAPVQFRAWDNPESAPEGTLPSLQIPSGELLGSSEVRPWLEKEYPLPEDQRALNGMPTQEAHTTALAHSHLILSKIFPAYSTLTPRPTILQLPFPLPTAPIPMSSTVYYSLPFWLRNLAGSETRQTTDRANKEREGIEGIEALSDLVREHVKDGKGWFLGASSPSPLDAIIASHVYPLMNLPETLELRRTIDAQLELKAYVERIMEVAAKNVRGHVRR